MIEFHPTQIQLGEVVINDYRRAQELAITRARAKGVRQRVRLLARRPDSWWVADTTAPTRARGR